MKLIKIYIVILLNLLINNSKAQLYIGGSISLANYFGEVGYNDYLVFSPISLTAMPGAELILGNRNKKNFRAELYVNYNSFSGSNEYTSVPSLKKYSNARIFGHLFRIGVSLLGPESVNGNFLGVGIQHFKSYYNSNFKLIPNGLQSSNGEVLELIIGKRLKKGRFKDLIELRYSMLFSSNDGFDGVSLGKWNDHLTKLSLSYTIPVRNIKYNYNTIKLLRKSRRHRTQCPNF